MALIENKSISAVIVIAIACLSVLVNYVNGHVALTFPPARKYDLDFLDNSRTKGPCGMPRGEWSFFLMIVLDE
jgi:hypothetical protein